MSMQDSSDRTVSALISASRAFQQSKHESRFFQRKRSIASTPWQHYELSIAEVQLEGLQGNGRFAVMGTSVHEL